MNDIDSLLRSLLVLALAGAIMVAWNAGLPAPLLWAGYAGAMVGAVMLVRWWFGVMR